MVEIIKLVEDTKNFQDFCKQIEAGRFSHAYIVLSPDELYNKTFCKLVAMKLNCLGVCKSCADCVKILKEVHPDVLNFPKGKSVLVEDANVITNELNVLPMFSKYKIFIINNFNLATLQAQNKLLKSIEEPPKNVIFLLNATSETTVLPTIMSRVNKIELMPLEKEKIEEVLNKANEDVKEMALLEGEGWIGKTLAYNQDENFIKNCDFIKDMLSNMKSSKDILKYSVIFSQKDGFETRLNLLEKEFELKLLSQNSDMSVEAVSLVFESINNAKKKFQANCNLGLITDSLLLRILEVKFICK